MKVKDWIMLISAGSLSMVVFCMMIIFIMATLDSSVDDKEIFTIVGPAFQTIVGGFIGLITGINIAKKEEENKDDSTVA
jgi:hypothetical protein